jgi:hypothetical protein
MAMTYSKFLTSSAVAASLLGAAVAAQAQIEFVNFTGLNTADGSSNGLITGGFATTDTELSVASTGPGNNYVYSVTYTGSDFDGDTFNDTLTFDVTVQGWQDGTITSSLIATGTGAAGSATIGTTDSTVFLNGDGSDNWSVGNFMDAGDSLQFTLGNFNVVNALGGATVVASTGGFGRVYVEESRSSNHNVVYGEGTSLPERYWSATAIQSDNVNSLGNGDLYVSAATGGNQFWGVDSVDFDLVVTTTVPEPSTYALLGGLLALGFVMVRRRR